MIQFLLVFSDWGILFLRLALAVIILASIPGLLAGKEKGAMTIPFSLMGLIAALSLVLGLFVQFGAVLAGIWPFVSGIKAPGNWMLSLLVLASALVLVFLGGGFISADSFFQIRIY